jgi:hypothetical protein
MIYSMISIKSDWRKRYTSLISQKMWTRLIKSTSLRLQKKSLCGYRSESNDSVARWLGKKENGEKIP